MLHNMGEGAAGGSTKKFIEGKKLLLKLIDNWIVYVGGVKN